MKNKPLIWWLVACALIAVNYFLVRQPILIAASGSCGVLVARRLQEFRSEGADQPVRYQDVFPIGMCIAFGIVDITLILVRLV